MSDFEPSPRSSKRRKTTTYGSNRSTIKSPDLKSPSVLHSISNAVSGISRRLFEKPTPQDATDSTNSSQQGSVGDASGSSYSADLERQKEDHTGEKIGGALDLDDTTEHGPAEGNSEESAATLANKSRTVNVHDARSTGTDSTRKRSSIRIQGNPTEAKRTTVNNAAEEPGSASTSKGRKSGRAALNGDSLDTASAHTPTPRSGTPSKNKQAVTSDTSNSLEITGAHLSITEMPQAEAEYESIADQHDVTISLNRRSSGRERRKPRRYSNDVQDVAQQQRKQPVGILTPSRGNKKKTQRSVAFEEEDRNTPKQLEFKDIQMPKEVTPNVKPKTKTKNSRSGAKAVQKLDTSTASLESMLDEDNDTQPELEIEHEVVPEIPIIPDFLSNITSVVESTPVIDEDPYLTAIKSKIISRLTGSSLVPLTNLATEYGKVHSLVKATVTAGEGNSVLVLGARGSGKTTLIETALADISSEHANDFHVVRLNGFQQTDDKIALREIWRQLGKEMQVEEDEINQVSSYADTMASLLHLLSHPEELAEMLDPEAPATTTKSVVFVLDEFDLFATHPRQTLLYNLFDIAQAKKAPIAVIGCSTRVDVAESLEKRVKSRFSHRWIHLAHPKSFTAFEDVVKAALCLNVDDDDKMLDTVESNWRRKWNQCITTTFLPSPSIHSLLQQVFYTTKSIPAAFSALYIPITNLELPPSTSSSPQVPPSSACALLTQPDSPLSLIPYLPLLHLSLLIAAARLDAIHNASVINFTVVYTTYVELAQRARMQASASGALAQGSGTKIWSREVARGAWEDLAGWEVIVPVVGAGVGSGKGGKGGDGEAETRMWRVDVSLEEIGACLLADGVVRSEILLKWCKEI